MLNLKSLNTKVKSPVKVVLRLAFIIGIVEMFIMYVFTLLPLMHPYVEGIIDAVVMSILSAIVIYLLLFRKEIRRSQHVLSQIINALDKVAIMGLTNNKGIIIDINEQFTKVSGYSKEEALGKDHHILNSGYHEKDFFKALWDTILSGDTWTGEIQNKTKSGSTYWVHSVIAPIRNEKNEITNFLAIRFDITERKKLEEKMFYSSKMAALGEMSSGMAHEINNPLAIIRGKSQQIQAELKLENCDKERVIKSLEMIDRTSERISKIIKGMRSISRNSENDEKEIYSFQKIIEETLDLCKERFKTNNIHFELNLKEEVQISCRPAEIVQVLLNLLNNSIDALLELQEPKWVTIKIEKENNLIKCIVTDSGKGISKQIAAKIMQPFFTTKEVGKGTGLGLSISKNIIENQGGKFYYNSESPNTQFVIELPR